MFLGKNIKKIVTSLLSITILMSLFFMSSGSIVIAEEKIDKEFAKTLDEITKEHEKAKFSKYNGTNLNDETLAKINDMDLEEFKEFKEKRPVDITKPYSIEDGKKLIAKEIVLQGFLCPDCRKGSLVLIESVRGSWVKVEDRKCIHHKFGVDELMRRNRQEQWQCSYCQRRHVNFEPEFEWVCKGKDF